MDSYLMNDGTRFTDQPGYATMIFGEEFENRDPRMFQTVRCPGYARIGKTHDVNRLYEAMIISTTGYMPIKYIQSGDYDKQTSNENDIILYRYAEVLLNYAEAKAELGTLLQTDLEQSIKLIRDRVGMPNMDMAAANANPDPVLSAQYPLVNGSNKELSSKYGESVELKWLWKTYVMMISFVGKPAICLPSNSKEFIFNSYCAFNQV